MLNTCLLNELIPNTTVPPSYYHYCVDGSYRTLTKSVNHSFVIAREQNDLFISGRKKDDTELAMVGERLDFKMLAALDTEAEAVAAAGALQVQARLNTNEGYIIAGINCGIEIWDVIRVYDSTARQYGVDFRVHGIGVFWHSTTLQYYHKLFLCAV
jgi:hypothetical protein